MSARLKQSRARVLRNHTVRSVPPLNVEQTRDAEHGWGGRQLKLALEGRAHGVLVQHHEPPRLRAHQQQTDGVQVLGVLLQRLGTMQSR